MLILNPSTGKLVYNSSKTVMGKFRRLKCVAYVFD
jgi:hypothetical protein